MNARRGRDTVRESLGCGGSAAMYHSTVWDRTVKKLGKREKTDSNKETNETEEIEGSAE